MPLELSKVHHYERDTATNRDVLLKTNPYVRFVNDVEAPVICQAGSFYSDGGDRIQRDDVQDWVWEAARKMNEAQRRRTNLVLPEEDVEKVEEVEPEEQED